MIVGQDVDGRLIKVEVATGVRGSGSARRGRGDRYGDGGDRDRDSIRENRLDIAANQALIFFSVYSQITIT